MYVLKCMECGSYRDHKGDCVESLSGARKFAHPADAIDWRRANADERDGIVDIGEGTQDDDA